MSATRRLTTAQAAVRYLEAQRVERDGREAPFFAGIFGIFGHGNVAGLGEALEARQDDGLRYYQARNEQAMVHAAAAFAKRSNRLRAFACTTSIGPGATNLVTGAALATINRLPVLLLPGDVFAVRRVAPVLQQLERPDSPETSVNDTLRPVSRFWDRIWRPEQLVDSLPEAMRVLTSPALTGTATVCLPQDVQAEAFDYPAAWLEPRIWHIPRPRPESSALGRAVEAIVRSRRPLLICGGGVLYAEATEALRAFCEATGVPVAETQAGKGALPWDHPQNCGPLGATGGLAANRLARDADVVIAVGTRLADFTTASKTAFADPDVRFVGLNVNEADAAKLRGIPLIADARAGLEELTEALGTRGWRVSDDHAREVARLRDEWNREIDRVRSMEAKRGLSQPRVLDIVNESTQPEDVVVCAAGSMPGDLMKLWRTTRPGGYHVEYGYSTMGYEIAGGLGARMASDEGEVIVMVGDGSYLLMSSELATAIQERVRLTVVLVDNHGFGSISGLAASVGADNTFNWFRMRDRKSGRLTGPPLPIDYAANAASLGCRTVRAGTPDELRAALREARAADRTTVIVVEVDPSVKVPGYESWWDVPVAEVSESKRVRNAREAYERERDRERWFA